MSDFDIFFRSVLKGFVMIGKALAFVLISLASLSGFVLVFGLICQELTFQWWYVLFWLVDLILLAAAIGDSAEDS